MIGGGSAMLELVIPRADVADALARRRRVGTVGRAHRGSGCPVIGVSSAPAARVILAHDGAEHLRAELEAEGVEVVATFAPQALAEAAADVALGREATTMWGALAAADALVLQAGRETLTPAAVAACDGRSPHPAPRGWCRSAEADRLVRVGESLPGMRRRGASLGRWSDRPSGGGSLADTSPRG